MTQSWVDFAGFMETGANVQQRPRGERGDVLAPAEVAEVFETLRVQFEAGDRAAIWAGICAGCRFNAYFSPSWTAFQADRGRDFSVIVDGVSV